MRRFLLCRPARTNRPARSLDVIIRADSPEAAVKAGARFVVGPVVALELNDSDEIINSSREGSQWAAL